MQNIYDKHKIELKEFEKEISSLKSKKINE